MSGCLKKIFSHHDSGNCRILLVYRKAVHLSAHGTDLDIILADNARHIRRIGLIQALDIDNLPVVHVGDTV